MKRIAYSLAVLVMLLSLHSNAQQDPQKLREWKDQKFSMFIHFGIYSVPAGIWDGKQISRGLSEQIQAHAGIYSDTYARIAKKFNPVNWNADSVALLAKNAGMRSIVITSKHHDGFCMFESAYTNFDIVDATPYRRDVLKDLSDACRRHGLKFGIYFSIIDWHFPQASPISSHNSDYVTPEHHEYNKKQVRELLTKYGEISELWFDMGSQSVEQSRELQELVHSLQPNCMVSSRLGNDMGDFTVMSDNQEPDYIIGVPWQSPASFFDETWGYRSWQKRTDAEEKFKEKLASLIRVVARGGNYLLNIGPKGDGAVVGYEKNILLMIGKWLNKNGEAIYGTQPDPFHHSFDWGQVTSKAGKLYLHIMKKPQSNSIELPGLNVEMSKAYFLDEKNKTANFSKRSSGYTITLPDELDVADEYKVLVIEFKNGFSTTPPDMMKFDKSAVLNSGNAFKYYSNSGIDYNTRYRSTIKESWNLQPAKTATYTPSIYYTEQERLKQLDIELDGKTFTVKLNEDETVPLQNDTASIKWSGMHLIGPFWSGIEGVHGKADSIDIKKPWRDSTWMKKDWQYGRPYELPADMMSAYYVVQEIESPVDQSVLISITSGDAIMVLLNGKQRLLHNNPSKKKQMNDVLQLDLKEGKNQLLIKLFNNFQEIIPFSIERNIPQIVYRKKLNSVKFTKGKHYTISWKQHQPATIHETMNVPNASIVISK